MAPRPVLLLDDRLLLDLLLETQTPELKSLLRRRQVYTTGLWLYRLCHATRDTNIVGALSGPFLAAPADIRTRAMAALVRLPQDVGLVSMRDLAPVMATLSREHRLNALSLEALAAATFLPGELVFTAGSEGPLLSAAAASTGIRVHSISCAP